MCYATMLLCFIQQVSTDLTGSGKKAVWVETGTHAREFIVVSVALGTINNVSNIHGVFMDTILKMDSLIEECRSFRHILPFLYLKS